MQRLHFIAHITLWEMIFCYCNSTYFKKRKPTNVNVLKNVKRQLLTNSVLRQSYSDILCQSLKAS